MTDSLSTPEVSCVDIYGIGPEWHWDAKQYGLAGRRRFHKSFLLYRFLLSDGTTRYVAQSITIDGDTIELRDVKTGGLWRGALKPLRSFISRQQPGLSSRDKPGCFFTRFSELGKDALPKSNPHFKMSCYPFRFTDIPILF